jgi:1D-myo-inositol 3-kinase
MDIEPAPIDLVIVGHATRDFLPNGQWRVGGTVVYAAITAARLGRRAAIVTSAPPDVLDALAEAAPGVPVAALPSMEATTFENRYDSLGRRRQYLRGQAVPLDPGAVPRDWLGAPFVLLAPVAQEVDASLASAFPRGRLAATAQGWLRQWDIASGLVRPGPWDDAERVLPHLSALILSQDDVLDPEPRAESAAARDETVRRVEERAAAWARVVPWVVITCGAEGADLFMDGAREHFSVCAVPEVDPTGAGDVFAAAFLCELMNTGDPRTAVQFANCAASFSVEADGTLGIPTRAQVVARLAITG